MHDMSAFTGAPVTVNGQNLNKPYEVLNGAQLGRDNNYQWARYPDGHIEPMYRTPDQSYYTPDGQYVSSPVNYMSQSELKAAGLSPNGTDDHGVPTFEGYNALGKPTTNSGMESDVMGAIAMAALTGGTGLAGALASDVGSLAGGLSAADAATLGDMAGGTADAVGTGGDLATTLGETGTAVGGSADGLVDASTGLFPGESGVAGTGTYGVTGGAGTGLGGAGFSLADLGITGSDLTRLGGALIPGALGLYGANELGNNLHDISQQNRTDRAPFLTAATGYLNDPASYFAGPGGAAIDSTLRKLSVTGNPFGSPFKMEMAADAGMRSWLDAVNGLGGLGTGGEQTTANLAAQAAGANASGLNALGYGISNYLNPPFTLSDYLRMQSQNKPGVT
jgi:hypothetical protein